MTGHIQWTKAENDHLGKIKNTKTHDYRQASHVRTVRIHRNTVRRERTEKVQPIRVASINRLNKKIEWEFRHRSHSFLGL